METAAKKKKLDCSSAEYITIDEGLCVQIMHLDSFDEEPATVALIDAYLEQNGYVNDMNKERLHHEIYMSDARKVALGFVSVDSTPYGNYYSKSDIWWLKRIEWMCKPFSEKMLKVSMAKQNAVTKTGRENMLQMVNDYEKAELCRLMGIGYAGFLDDNKELQISCSALILVGEKDSTGKVKQYNKEWSKRTGIKMIWIPNAAHNSNVDNPEFVNDCIENFLAEMK